VLAAVIALVLLKSSGVWRIAESACILAYWPAIVLMPASVERDAFRVKAAVSADRISGMDDNPY
jgi:hypothetical protein